MKQETRSDNQGKDPFSNTIGLINLGAYFCNLNQIPDVRAIGEEFKGNKTLQESVNAKFIEEFKKEMQNEELKYELTYLA